MDGLVGPKTSDALNRELVGIWYSKYETPKQLTTGKRIIAMLEDLMVLKGVSI